MLDLTGERRVASCAAFLEYPRITPAPRDIDFLSKLWSTKRIDGAQSNVSIILVCHLITDSMSLIAFLQQNFCIEAVIAKPKSIDRKVEEAVTSLKIRVLKVDRENINAYAGSIRSVILNRQCRKLLIIDMGGYFSRCLSNIYRDIGSDFLGVIEDTENGIKKYQACPRIPVPFYSVASSVLKRPENRLVGMAILDGVLKATEKYFLSSRLPKKNRSSRIWSNWFRDIGHPLKTGYDF